MPTANKIRTLINKEGLNAVPHALKTELKNIVKSTHVEDWSDLAETSVQCLVGCAPQFSQKLRRVDDSKTQNGLKTLYNNISLNLLEQISQYGTLDKKNYSEELKTMCEEWESQNDIHNHELKANRLKNNNNDNFSREMTYVPTAVYKFSQDLVKSISHLFNTGNKRKVAEGEDKKNDDNDFMVVMDWHVRHLVYSLTQHLMSEKH